MSDDAKTLELTLSNCRSLREVAGMLGSVGSTLDLASLKVPSFGGRDPAADYEEILEAAGYQVISWDQNQVLVYADGVHRLMTRGVLHDEICGAACPYCNETSCFCGDHPDAHACRHYIGYYCVVNCEFSWEGPAIARLLKRDGDDWVPVDELAENTCETLRSALGEVNYRMTTNEAWVSEKTAMGFPLFFASDIALKKLATLSEEEG